MSKIKLVRGSLVEVKNTNKKSRFESDTYWIVILKDTDGTDTGLMMTKSERDKLVSRYWANKEDWLEEKVSPIKRLINKIKSIF